MVNQFTAGNNPEFWLQLPSYNHDTFPHVYNYASATAPHATICARTVLYFSKLHLFPELTEIPFGYYSSHARIIPC